MHISTIGNISVLTGIDPIILREMRKNQIPNNIDILILSNSVEPKTGWDIRDLIHKDLGVLKSPSIVYPKIRDLKNMSFLVSQKNPYSAKNKKECAITTVGEEYLTARLEAYRRILNYSCNLPLEKKNVNEYVESRLMEELVKQYAVDETELLTLASFMRGPNYSFGIIKNIEKDIGVSISTSTMNKIFSELLEKGIIDYATPGCSECGKPPGWVFGNGKPKLMYKITKDGENYYFAKILSELGFWEFVIDSYLKPKLNGNDASEWLYMGPRRPKSKRSYRIIELD